MENIDFIIDFEGFVLKNLNIYRQLSIYDVAKRKVQCYNIYSPNLPDYKSMPDKDKKTIRYCTKMIHGLYHETNKPNFNNRYWINNTNELENLLLNLKGTIAYKGGILEQRILNDLRLTSLDLEEYGCKKTPKDFIFYCNIHKERCKSFHCSVKDVVYYAKWIKDMTCSTL